MDVSLVYPGVNDAARRWRSSHYICFRYTFRTENIKKTKEKTSAKNSFNSRISLKPSINHCRVSLMECLHYSDSSSFFCVSQSFLSRLFFLVLCVCVCFISTVSVIAVARLATQMMALLLYLFSRLDFAVKGREKKTVSWRDTLSSFDFLSGDCREILSVTNGMSIKLLFLKKNKKNIFLGTTLK